MIWRQRKVAVRPFHRQFRILRCYIIKPGKQSPAAAVWAAMMRCPMVNRRNPLVAAFTLPPDPIMTAGGDLIRSQRSVSIGPLFAKFRMCDADWNERISQCISPLSRLRCLMPPFSFSGAVRAWPIRISRSGSRLCRILLPAYGASPPHLP